MARAAQSRHGSPHSGSQTTFGRVPSSGSARPWQRLGWTAFGSKSRRWQRYPILRSTGGFITATLIQLLIQQRITTISNQYLIKRDQPSGKLEIAYFLLNLS